MEKRWNRIFCAVGLTLAIVVFALPAQSDEHGSASLKPLEETAVAVEETPDETVAVGVTETPEGVVAVAVEETAHGEEVVEIEEVDVEDTAVQMDDMEVFSGFTRPPAMFSHNAHMGKMDEAQCAICHHDELDGDYVEYDGTTCMDCHGESQPMTPELRRKFHSNCTGCHRKLLKEHKETGPVTCGECHKKQ